MLHFTTSALHILILAIFMHIRVDHAEPKTKIQAEQVQWVFEGPQASRFEDAKIIVIKSSLGALTNAPVFYFEYCFMIYFDCALSL
jgi:hypothetical protein